MFGFKKAQRPTLRTTEELLKSYADIAVNPRVVMPYDAAEYEQRRQQRALNEARIKADAKRRARAVTTEADACHCCRSHDYVMHNGRQQCAYCRVPRKGGRTVKAPNGARYDDAQYAAYLDAKNRAMERLYGLANAAPYNPEGRDTSGRYMRPFP